MPGSIIREDKAAFVKAIGDALAMYSRENVSHIDYKIQYKYIEIAEITFTDGSTQGVDITGCPCAGIMDRITKRFRRLSRERMREYERKTKDNA